MPNCEYDIDYTVSIPAEITAITTCDESSRTCTIETNDNNLSGDYQFIVDGSADGVSSDPDLVIDFSVLDSCGADTVSLVNPAADLDVTYYIDYTPST